MCPVLVAPFTGHRNSCDLSTVIHTTEETQFQTVPEIHFHFKKRWPSIVDIFPVTLLNFSYAPSLLGHSMNIYLACAFSKILLDEILSLFGRALGFLRRNITSIRSRVFVLIPLFSPTFRVVKSLDQLRFCFLNAAVVVFQTLLNACRKGVDHSGACQTQL